MANRSYLYSTNIAPSPEANKDDRYMIGISEWNYDIPIVFKVLLSANPKKCRSAIFDVAEEVAIIGDYNEGVARLFDFLDRIKHPEIVPLREEAREFLTAEKNRNRFFVLECGEIFEMEDEPIDKQNERLLAEIQNIEPAVTSAIAALPTEQKDEPKPAGLFARLFGKKPTPARKTDPLEAFYSLGLGNWSNILYFDPSGSE